MNIGIAGAGITGRLLAWQLARSGVNVTLFDKDTIQHRDDNGHAAAYTAAGMLTPFSEAESAEAPIVQMGLRSLDLWPEIVKQLSADVDFHQTGSLILAHRNDHSDMLNFRQHLARIPEVKNSYTHLDKPTLFNLEPDIAARFSEATYIPNEAWLSPQRLLAVLADDLAAMGATLVPHTEITALSEGAIHGKHAEGAARTWAFDKVVDCRGLGAKPDMPNLRGVRGEVIWLHAPEVTLNHLVRLMHPRYRIYIVPRANHTFVVGATQIESDNKRPITVRSALELLSAAYSVHSGFAEASILQTRVNCRPALADNFPTITQENGLMRVNGLFRHGFLLAPALVEAAFELLTKDAPTLHLPEGIIKHTKHAQPCDAAV